MITKSVGHRRIRTRKVRVPWDRENQYWINNDNTYFLRNADYLRLKNAELGYTFRFEGLKKAGISNLRLYANGSNLFTIDGVKDADRNNVMVVSVVIP